MSNEAVGLWKDIMEIYGVKQSYCNALSKRVEGKYKWCERFLPMNLCNHIICNHPLCVCVCVCGGKGQHEGV
jgi:hypothetical protein